MLQADSSASRPINLQRSTEALGILLRLPATHAAQSSFPANTLLWSSPWAFFKLVTPAPASHPAVALLRNSSPSVGCLRPFSPWFSPLVGCVRLARSPTPKPAVRRNGCNHTSHCRTTPTDGLSWSRLTTNANPTHRFASGHTLPVSCRVLRTHRTPALLLTVLTSAATSLPRAAQWARPTPPSWPPYNEISPGTPGRFWSKLTLNIGLFTFLKADSEACKFTLSRSTALVYSSLKRRQRLCFSSVWSVCLARHDLSTTRASCLKPWRTQEINHPWALAI